MSDIDKLGMGVMINMLGGNEKTVLAHNGAAGKIIQAVEFNEEELTLRFKDNTAIKAWDDGQSCCENRYMTTDDDLPAFVGAEFRDMEVKDAPDIADEYGDHEVQFLAVNTSLGTFTIETHNEHNGYYGGFYIKIRNID